MRREGSRRAVGAWAASVALVLALGGCGGAPVPPSKTGGGGSSLPDEGDLAPAFELADLAGHTVTLEDTQGAVRLLDFWATWCAPCREEIPMLKELHAQYGDQGLKIISIADETAEEVKPFVTEHDIEYTSLVGNERINGDYGVFGLPTAFLVDRDGRIVKKWVGIKMRRVVEKEIRELLELPPAT